MPNSKKGEGQGQNAGGGQGAREQVANAGQQIQQGAEQVGNRLREGYDSAREGAVHGYRQAEGTIARNPAPSVLIGFGVGFGLGLVLCSMFTDREETWAEKYLPESLQDIPDRYQSLVSSSVKSLPDVSDHYHSLVSSLKSLPKAVHQYLPRSVAKHLG